MAFELLLHVATLGAVLLFFASDILLLGEEWFRGLWNRGFRRRPGWIYGWALLAGTFLTACVALPFKKFVEGAFTSPLLVGGGFDHYRHGALSSSFFPSGGEKTLSFCRVLYRPRAGSGHLSGDLPFRHHHRGGAGAGALPRGGLSLLLSPFSARHFGRHGVGASGDERFRSPGGSASPGGMVGGSGCFCERLRSFALFAEGGSFRKVALVRYLL